MGSLLPNPFHQFMNSAAVAYSGGVLRFYISGTSTPLAVYSDRLLTSSIGTSVTLNSAGRPSTLVFLQPQQYKITLEDSDGVIVWTADPVNGNDFAIFPKWTPGSGSPNGVVAGTAGSSGVLPDVYFDYTNSVLYICTTSGTASTAIWTAVNASAATPAVTPPQGRLTLTSATPVISTDVTAATAVYYSPYTGNLVPVYNGSSFTPTTFSELTLTLASQHVASSIYDVFVFSNSGVLTLATGPAWTTATAGSGARGSGAGTTQLSRVLGYYTNAVSMTGRNGATTYTIGANLGTYVGSLLIDGSNGQVSCHVTYGQSRKWAVWNAYNRVPIVLQAGDTGSSWTYATATIRASNNSSANSLSLFMGLAEEYADLSFLQYVVVGAGGGASVNGGIGYNSTSAFSGKRGTVPQAGGAAFNQDIIARYTPPPSIGLNTVTALEKGSGAGTITWNSGNADMLLTARWNG